MSKSFYNLAHLRKNILDCSIPKEERRKFLQSFEDRIRGQCCCNNNEGEGK